VKDRDEYDTLLFGGFPLSLEKLSWSFSSTGNDIMLCGGEISIVDRFCHAIKVSIFLYSVVGCVHRFSYPECM
jgi:hypothetical protein